MREVTGLKIGSAQDVMFPGGSGGQIRRLTACRPGLIHLAESRKMALALVIQNMTGAEHLLGFREHTQCLPMGSIGLAARCQPYAKIGPENRQIEEIGICLLLQLRSQALHEMFPDFAAPFP